MPTKHAPAFDKRGARYLVPPLQLCSGKLGRIETVFPERVDCKRCLAKLAQHDALRGDKDAMRVWLLKHGIGATP